MSRIHWVVGNWKQNLLRADARTCAQAIADGATSASPVRVGLAPTYLALDVVRAVAQPDGPVHLFAQDVAAQDSGAFTGEVGPAMLADAGATGSIIGHSERRALFADTDELVSRKLLRTLEAGLSAILCVGEGLEARDAGKHETVVISQLSAAFSNVTPEMLSDRLILAYEPVWAIGTGRTATPEQADAMHRRIRSWLQDRYGEAGRDRSILYGGSVKPGNAAELIAAPDVDGFLVGGASLDPASFLDIVRAAKAGA